MSAPELRLSARAQKARASEIRELLKLVDRPSMISFAGGIPDPALFNLEAFHGAWRALFASPLDARAALQYSTTEGYLPLRQWLADHMRGLGVPAGADNILVTTGSQQGLDLIGKLLLDTGSLVLTARPSYLGALQAMSVAEPVFAPLDGPYPAGGDAPRLVYLVPDFANPTGETMTLAARQQALAVARTHNAVVVEDAAYTALRYEGTPQPPIAALDAATAGGGIEGSRTLYCGTFSKTLSPGLRVGWICGPTTLVRRLALLKQGADLHTASLNQMLLHQVALATIDSQVNRIRGVYRLRRDSMLAALERYAPPGVSWSRPEGGMFIWVTLPAGTDSAALLAEAVKQDVAFVPGRAFHPDGAGRNTLRLSFALADEARIELGIFKLMTLVADRTVARAS